MRTSTKILFVLGTLTASGFLFAAFYSGNDLHIALKDYRSGNTQNPTTAAAAAGFTVGVADVMDERLDTRTNFKFCIPNRVNQGQLIDVVLSHLEKYPERRHMSGWSLVEEAYAAAFPCP
jgi:hypothetical protein